jgi:hypothetical protein
MCVTYNALLNTGALPHVLLPGRAVAPLAAWSLTQAANQIHPAAAEMPQQQQQRQARVASSSNSRGSAGRSKPRSMQTSARCGMWPLLQVQMHLLNSQTMVRMPNLQGEMQLQQQQVMRMMRMMKD